MDIALIVQSWDRDEPKFKKLGEITHAYIIKNIAEYEILPEVAFRTKELLSIIKKIKKKSKEKNYSYNDLHDKLGIRIICNFKEDLDKVDLFLKEHFLIKKAEYKKDDINYDRLDYTSNHYDLAINPSNITGCEDFSDLIFEVQVRTLNQHAWSNTAHSLSYKQEAELTPYLKRKVYRLLSLYEIADDEISLVNSELSINPDNLIYSILRKLEGKIYKFVRLDFDRETSLSNIRSLFSYISINDQNKMSQNIDSFMLKHDGTIKQIFQENRARFIEIPLLTQPEVFIIWYMVENNYFQLRQNMSPEFDEHEINQITILWGKSLF